jgi:hypothetical protein
LTLSPKQAKELGMTHEGSFWGIPLYLGNLEFAEHEAVEIAIKYRLMDPIFHLCTALNWLFTPPGVGIMVWIAGEIQD